MKFSKQIKSYDDDFFKNLINFNDHTDQSLLPTVTRDLARQFSSRVFKNIDNWPYIYFTSGITEAINFLVLSKPTYFQPDDYRYLYTLSTIKSPSDSCQYYFSYPYAGNGKFLTIPDNKNLILDCSYIFASNMNCEQYLPNNIEYILFGVSKSHNLANLRCGWFFSKQKIESFHVLQYEYNYLGKIHKQILDAIIAYDGNYLYQKHKDKISKLYFDHNLEEFDTNLFSIKGRQKIPYYTLL